jgi:aconitate hydratase
MSKQTGIINKKSKSSFTVNNKVYHYYSIKQNALAANKSANRLPISIKILLENLLRHQKDKNDLAGDIKALETSRGLGSTTEIAYHPARVLMQDFTGVPAIVDLAAMRYALVKKGLDPQKINPISNVDLVIDHSVNVDRFSTKSAFEQNVAIEMIRNKERYEFLKWGQGAFKNFSLVPPGTGICHQVNLEYLAKVVCIEMSDNECLIYPDTLVGTDSHTTMINGLGILGWGVGGIEAEAVMLGQAISMQIPDVVGFELTGQLAEGITATDLVLHVVQILRNHGVVGKFVEFYGNGLTNLPLADRATIANMAPEYGATCGFFPVDKQTLAYLHLTGRDQQAIDVIEAYCKVQGMWRDDTTPIPNFAECLHLDMGSIEANLAGPSRPQDRVPVCKLKTAMDDFIQLNGRNQQLTTDFPLADDAQSLRHGDLVIAAITSCTNTSNPAVMLAAGLLAKKAVAKGLVKRSWVKASLAPGSRVVTDYLEAAGLQQSLDKLGFNLVGYGCTTCIGNSGPLSKTVQDCVEKNDLIVCAVLSGNRNFEGRIHPQVKASWLASPPLVVAYALAGTTRIDLSQDSIGIASNGEEIYLKDIWPSNAEIAELLKNVHHEMFAKRYNSVFDGDQVWQAIESGKEVNYQFSQDSTYIQRPPFFEKKYRNNHADILDAPILAMYGDSVTTDHISPAGAIPKDSPAAEYLREHGVAEADFNSYGSRRGNHEIMMRGTFGNIRISNTMTQHKKGGYTHLQGQTEVISIFDAAQAYQRQQKGSVIIAGKEYGTGSSRDWAAKGTLLLGVKAVIAESFERIHRSNLAGMGVLPLQFMDGEDRKSLMLTGDESLDIFGLCGELCANQKLDVIIYYSSVKQRKIQLLCRLDTAIEVEYYRAGGVLTYVLNQIVAQG